ncbi:hypothetical protein SELMODRAFT_428876 [Selaginella moellendorffii]|uniref:Uncharacterized protein n=1 Tax=Selaginella moellendorffii TaxID=88036 RepID=D8T4A4_SELML|nr:hypothetical protein SELMODRAFT_428876 [Selaginella moellendorffii]
MQESGPCGNWNPHCEGRQHGRVCHDHNAENKSVGTSVVDVENYDVVILNFDAVKDKAAAPESCELTKKFPSFKATGRKPAPKIFPELLALRTQMCRKQGVADSLIPESLLRGLADADSTSDSQASHSALPCLQSAKNRCVLQESSQGFALQRRKEIAFSTSTRTTVKESSRR